jgi:predicted transcriptional regulator of viral defense system
METNLRTLGPNEAKVILALRERGQPVARAQDVIRLLGSEPTARKVIHNLIRKGWLSRLVGGRYLVLPPEYGPENIGENNALALASAVMEPSYVGWWTAASFHGFTTQKPASITVATQRQVPPRTIEGTDIRFIMLTPRKFFGFETYQVYGRDVRMSSPVKTVVDCIDRPDLAGGFAELARIVAGAAADVDTADLAETALKMHSTSLLQRVGFLTDLVGWSLPEEVRKKVRAAIPASARSFFGRRESKEGDIGYVAEWGLLVHLNRRELLSDVPHRRREDS